MANIKPVILLSFTLSIGIMFLVLACALPQYNNWWPLFVAVFYILAPIPLFISKRINEMTSTSNSVAHFVTSGIVLSAFALPIVLSRAPSPVPVIEWGACWLTLTANIVIFFTFLGFILSYSEDVEYSMW